MRGLLCYAFGKGQSKTKMKKLDQKKKNWKWLKHFFMT